MPWFISGYVLLKRAACQKLQTKPAVLSKGPIISIFLQGGIYLLLTGSCFDISATPLPLSPKCMAHKENEVWSWDSSFCTLWAGKTSTIAMAKLLLENNRSLSYFVLHYPFGIDCVFPCLKIFPFPPSNPSLCLIFHVLSYDSRS